MRITSATNVKIKRVLHLRGHAGDRRESGLTIVEGLRELDRAVAAGVEVEEIYLCPELLAGQKKVTLRNGFEKDQGKIIEVSPAVFDRIAYGDRKEGVVALCRPPRRELTQLRFKNPALCVVLDSVEKPGNLGAILRTCDAVGVDAVIVDPEMDIYSPNAIRASVGTVFTVPVVGAAPAEAVAFLRAENICIVAASPAGKVSFFQTDLRRSTAVVVGSEDQGLSDFWLKAAGTAVAIPMKGAADSLNVSVSAAVILYEALRQRSAGKR